MNNKESLLVNRFLAKINICKSGCWEWTGSLYFNGYGQFRNGNHTGRAHRFAYEYFIDSIPQGMTLDHLCRNRKCVNPYHLEIVSRKINVLRGVGITAIYSKATHCIHGHPFNKENTYINPQGRRKCRLCNKYNTRKYRYSFKKVTPNKE